MEDILDYMGYANILEKVTVTIDGEEKEFYKKIDFTIGFWYKFVAEEKFVALSGKQEKKLIPKLFSKTNYRIVDFRTLRALAEQNKNIFNFDNFEEQYAGNIAAYYTYHADETPAYQKINNPTLLQKIKGKDYDDSVIHKGTDISKMYEAIKKTIVAQDEQIMQILTSLYKNQKVVNSSLNEDMISKLRENIIIYGPTGTGKTEILKRIASIYEVPIVIEDATSLSETGYVGRKITDMLEDLYLAADKNMEKAQKGILVIDEFDKLAERASLQDHVSRSGVQRSLLKLLDGATFYIKDKKFDTSKLTVVALGAFSNIVPHEDYSKVTTTDFVNYGLMKELMGRFSNLIAMNSLSKEDIKRILIESDFSPLNTYKLLFDSMNIVFSYDDEFVDYIADEAIMLNTGARSLKTIFDDVISSALFRIFAGEYSAIHLTKPTLEKKAYVLKTK